jgi:large subunit ribosomal protein L22
MALARAITKHAKVSPQKARVVINLIRGKNIPEALFQLSQTGTKAGRMLIKTLNSAVANAVHNKDANSDDLFISEAYVDKGTFHKRAWTRSRGMRAPIERKTSHLTIAVDVKSKIASEEKK